MRYRNGWIFTERGYVRGGFCVENGRFVSVTADAPEEPDAVDLGGMRVLPGLIDLHIHGGCGADVSDGEPAALLRMARFLLQNGVTSFVPTAVTLPSETLNHALAAVKTLRDSRPDGAARVLGARMEGPYLSERRKGAHNAAYLRKPDLEAFRRLYDDCGGIIRIVDVIDRLAGDLAAEVIHCHQAHAVKYTDCGRDDVFQLEVFELELHVLS